MNKKFQNTVPFDPGFSSFRINSNTEIYQNTAKILNLKSKNQMKNQLKLIEKSLLNAFTNNCLICYACVIYGSFIASKYKEEPAYIENNFFISLSEEEKKGMYIHGETIQLKELLRRVRHNIFHLLKRESIIPKDFEEYMKTYIEFIELNDQFKNLVSTDQIKIPKNYSHFFYYSKEKLEQIETEIYEIIKNRDLEKIVNIS